MCALQIFIIIIIKTLFFLETKEKVLHVFHVLCHMQSLCKFYITSPVFSKMKSFLMFDTHTSPNMDSAIIVCDA